MYGSRPEDHTSAMFILPLLALVVVSAAFAAYGFSIQKPPDAVQSSGFQHTHLHCPGDCDPAFLHEHGPEAHRHPSGLRVRGILSADQPAVLVLANRYIRKDENLVKSADRLR